MKPTAHRVLRRSGLSDVELEIFAATERLLEKIPIAELSVGRIVKEAGTSRTSFYYYFNSKLAVLAALLDELTDQLVGPFDPLLSMPDASASLPRLWLDLVPALAELYIARRTIVRPVLQQWPAEPELRAAWLRAEERATDTLAAAIDYQRTTGLAAPGPDSRRLAQSIVWASAHALSVSDFDGGASIDSLAAALEPQFMMLGATLSAPREATAGRRRRR